MNRYIKVIMLLLSVAQMLFLIFLCAMAMQSCTPQQRLNRMHKRHPELFENRTVIIIDTVYIEKHVVDTVTRIEYHDTVTVINDSRVFLKYFYDTLRQEIYHEVECKSDTLIREIEHIETRAIVKYGLFNLRWWQWLVLALLALAVIVVLSFLMRLFKVRE